jgi:hypothetical protein
MKNRKRYFVGIPNGRAPRQLFALQFTPDVNLYGFGYRQVLGPFRTRLGAELALRSPALTQGWSVRQVERFAAKVAAKFGRKAA